MQNMMCVPVHMIYLEGAVIKNRIYYPCSVSSSCSSAVNKNTISVSSVIPLYLDYISVLREHTDLLIS